MSWTYTTLKQAIQDFTENTETSFVSHIDDFIQAAEERIFQSVDLDLFRTNASTTLTVADKYLRPPSDYLTPHSLSINVDGRDVFLVNKDVEYVQDYGGSGQPKFYAHFRNDMLILAPTPDDDYAVELHYFYRPASITTAGTTWIGTNASQALLYGSLIEAYIFMKGETDIISTYTQRFTEALMRLKNYGEGRENVDSYREGLVRTPRT